VDAMEVTLAYPLTIMAKELPVENSKNVSRSSVHFWFISLRNWHVNLAISAGTNKRIIT
jgi:hypothetical protein